MDIKWMLFGLLMLADLFFLIAVITKYLEVKRASTWLSAEGKVTSSRSEARRVDKSSGTGRDRVVDYEMRNFATVGYSFKANGQRQTGNRISIGHDVGNYQVEEKLARYPVGKVVTVFYDPAKPTNNVLERDIATKSFETAILIGALVAVIALFFVLSTEDIGGLLQRYIPDHGQGSASTLLVGMAVFAALLGYSIYQRGQATFAWPTVEGVVASSAVDTVQIQWAGTLGMRHVRNAFRSRTIYGYTVNGVAYQSDRVSYGAQVYATFRLLAKQSAGRFAAGDNVEIYYNPAAPSEAVLVRGAPGQWLIWVVVAGLCGGAAKLIGFF